MSTVETAPTPREAGVAALELRDLDLAYRVRGRNREVVRTVSFAVEQGECYGLVGESGCGKSTVALAIARYLPSNGVVTGGGISVAGTDVLALRGEALRAYHRDTFSMVYQNPGTALNPTLRVSRQLTEVFELRGASRSQATSRALEALMEVKIADPVSVMTRYPHELSGGMQQRVVIAMALATDPKLLVLDEPTTGLDATVEAEVLDLITELQTRHHTAVLFISHNLGVIGKMCRRVGVLYAGQLVEEGTVADVLQTPRHPYTVGLLRCVPQKGRRKEDGRLDTIPGFLPEIGTSLPGCVFVDRCALAQDICREQRPEPFVIGPRHTSRCFFHEQAASLPRDTAERGALPVVDRSAQPLLQIEDLAKTFHQGGRNIQALAGVSATLQAGETLGLVGESGSGKTTFARALLGIIEPTRGSVAVDGRELPSRLAGRTSQDVASMQIVFQNPDSALNRRHRVSRLLLRSLKKLLGVTGEKAERRSHELIDDVRLPQRSLAARPTQLSGGQKQRVAIARAFSGEPRLVVCDEPTSALDVSVQAAILNLLVDLQAEHRTSYVFISHDLGVVRYLSDRIAVLYLGRLMELGTSQEVFDAPHHPYTEALLSAVPSTDPGHVRIKLSGDIPSAADPPSGCVFQTRCPRKLGAICEDVVPPLADVGGGRLMACHIPLEELRRIQQTPPGSTS